MILSIVRRIEKKKKGVWGREGVEKKQLSNLVQFSQRVDFGTDAVVLEGRTPELFFGSRPSQHILVINAVKPS